MLTFREKREEKVKVDPQHRSLLPTLRPYQADAVRSVWLVKVDPQRRVIPGRCSQVSVASEG